MRPAEPLAPVPRRQPGPGDPSPTSPHVWGKAAASCLCQQCGFFLLGGGGLTGPVGWVPLSLWSLCSQDKLNLFVFLV